MRIDIAAMAACLLATNNPDQHNSMKYLILLLAYCVVFVSTAVAETEPLANTGRFSLASGVEYSSGKYGGTSTTDILYVPLTARYSKGPYSFNMTVPYISVTSSENAMAPIVGPMGNTAATGSIPVGMDTGMGAAMGAGTSTGTGMPGTGTTGSGMPGTPTTTAGTTTQSGMGDIMASLGYDFYTGEQLGLTILGGVKFGTANSNKGLGTGQNDYSAELDGAYSINDTSMLAAIGYKVVGQPVAYTLNNIAYGAVGVTHRMSENTRASLMLNGAQSSYAFISGRLALAAGWSEQLSNTTNWSISLAKGLSSGSPDWDGVISISISY